MSRQTSALPAQSSTFVGRTSELEALTNLVRSSRLVTVTGAAGMGKTRLAVEAVRLLAADGARQVAFVALAGLSDGALLVPEVASRLGVPERKGEPLAETIVAHVAGRPLLLLLDNCEHLVGASAQLVETLLRGCAEVRVLATSLLPLRVPGEVVWRISPLSLPGRRAGGRQASAGGSSMAGIAGSEAVRLFETRARQVRPEFAVEPSNANAVALVCRRLEGIPLAIELAAARMETLTVQDVLTHLEERLRPPVGDARTSSRHRTLRAALDWGHGLIDEPERRLFRRVSVFAGGFELPAAEAVCAGDGVAREDVQGLLFRLVERSLVQADVRRTGPARYHLLEPVRQYGLEQLAESGERPETDRRHAAFCLALAEEAAGEERGLDQPGWLRRLEAELDNLRSALHWFRRHEPCAWLQLASALSWFWVTRGHFTEGRQWLEGSLAAAPADVPERARALLAAARVCFWQGDYAAAGRFGEEALAQYERCGTPVDLGWTLTLLGGVHAYLGQYEAGRRRFAEALAVTDDEVVTLEAMVGLAELLVQSGDLPAALTTLQEVARRGRGPSAPRGRAALLLGIVRLLGGDGAAAAADLAWSLEIFQRLGNRYGAAAALDAVAALAVAQSSPVRALRLCGAASALRTAIRSRLAPHWHQLIETTIVQPARSAAGDAADAAWAEGERMSFDEAIRCAKEDLPVGRPEPAPAPPAAEPAPRPAAVPAPAGLTRREMEIASLVADGLTNREMAERLFISERTVEGHVERLRKKLGVRSRHQIGASIARERAWPSS